MGVTESIPVVRSFRAHPASLYEVRQFVRGLASGAGLPEPTTADLLVAVSEACANSILHTNSSYIRVRWVLSGACAEVQVQDSGIFRRRAPIAEEGSGGHGIPLMMALVDEFSVREGTARDPGTVIRLVKCFDR